MGRKKKRRKGKGSAGPSPAALQRLSDEQLGGELRDRLERSKPRQALDVLKELRRRSLLLEHGEAAEEAYLLRAQELARKDLHAEALELLEGAFGSGLASRRLLETALRCAVQAGRGHAARQLIEAAELEEAERAELLADLAVLLPPSGKEAAESPLPEDAATVLRAFALYHEGRDEEAKSELVAIPRRSPFARWRLLLRGLSGAANGDLVGARESWARADGSGLCGEVARALRREAGPSTNAPRAEQDPRIGLIREIQACARSSSADEEDDDQEELVRVIARVMARARARPGLDRPGRERLFRCLIGETYLAPSAYGKLSRLLARVPEDPYGRRQAALRYEEDHPGDASGVWTTYAGDLDQLAGEPSGGLSLPDLRLARALVWERAGDAASSAAWQFRAIGCPCPICRAKQSRAKYRDILDPGAIDCYEESLLHDPYLDEVREKLAKLLLAAGRKKEAESTLLEGIERNPSRVSYYLELGTLCFERSSYLKAERYLERARRLEPLNPAVLARVADCRVASAWRRTKKERFDLARKDFQKVEDLLEGDLEPRHLLKQAAVEAAAGDTARADSLLERAITGGMAEGEGCFLLADRLHELHQEDRAQRYTRRLGSWIEALPQEVGAAEQALSVYEALWDEGPWNEELEALEAELVEYFERVQDLDFTEEARLRFCHCFGDVGDLDLLVDYAAAGARSFPENEEFLRLGLTARMERGDSSIPAETAEWVQARLERLAGDGDERDAAAGDEDLRPAVRQLQELLELVKESPPAEDDGPPRRELGGTGAPAGGRTFFQKVFTFTKGS